MSNSVKSEASPGAHFSPEERQQLLCLFSKVTCEFGSFCKFIIGNVCPRVGVVYLFQEEQVGRIKDCGGYGQKEAHEMNIGQSLA